MPTRTPRIPDAVLAKIPGKALYRMATAGAEVVIGGDHPTLVLPEARASKWGGECWLRVRHADADEIDRADKAAKAQGKALKTAEKASLRTERGKPVLDIPTTGRGRRHEIREGSLKWDVVYDSPAALPADGIERFQLEFPAGLTWHYQPALTLEEIAEGAERPENVVGSYAGYFDKAGRYLDKNGEEVANYETGKFAHLYRPEMVDAAGNRCWAEQEMVGNELRVTLPAEWMETATYPVTLDPTFGYESIAATAFGVYSTRAYAFRVPQPVSGGVVTKISVAQSYFQQNTNSRGKGAVYGLTSGKPNVLLGQTNEFAATTNSGGTVVWHDFPYASGPTIVASTDYFLGFFCTDSAPTIVGYMRYDSAGSGNVNYQDVYSNYDTSPDFPAPFPPAAGTTTAGFFSIYATYTESVGGTTSSADSGNIAVSGSSATGVQTHISSADSGTVSIAGSVASGIRSLVSLAAAASIAIAGFSAEGVYTPTGSTVSSASPCVVAIAGTPANGVQTHISSADPGIIAILGSDANAATGYASTADPGTIAITGADATASRTYVATAGPTSIAIAGSPAYATKSGGSSTSSGISLIFGKVILHL